MGSVVMDNNFANTQPSINTNLIIKLSRTVTWATNQLFFKWIFQE